MFAVKMARDDFPGLQTTGNMARFDGMQWRDPAAARENQQFNQGFFAAGRESSARGHSDSNTSAAASPRSPSSETIHSGHFMVSNPHKVKKHSGYNFDNATKETAGSYSFSTNDQQLEIDASFSKLFECMSLAYHECIIVSPKWKTFKGLKLSWKDKIRLNNAIWREWHNQFILGRKPLICRFSAPLIDNYNTPQAVILEGKYWKRTLCAVVKEYQKWRIFYKRRASISGLVDDEFEDEWFPHRTQQHLQKLNQDFVDSDMDAGTPMVLDETTLLSEFSDTLFSSLNPSFPFPNPKEIAHAGINADILQPGLIQLQPSLDDVMDTFDPLPELMKSISNTCTPSTYVFTGNQSQTQLLQQSSMNTNPTTMSLFQTSQNLNAEESVDGMSMDDITAFISGRSNVEQQQNVQTQQQQNVQTQQQQNVQTQQQQNVQTQQQQNLQTRQQQNLQNLQTQQQQQQRLQQQQQELQQTPQGVRAESSLSFDQAGIQQETQTGLINVLPAGLVPEFGLSGANLIQNQISGTASQLGVAQLLMPQNVPLSQNILEQLGAMGGLQLANLQSNIILQQQLQQQMQQLKQQQSQQPQQLQQSQQPLQPQQPPQQQQQQPQTEVVNQYLPLQVQINQVSPQYAVQQPKEFMVPRVSAGSSKPATVSPISLHTINQQQQPQIRQQRRRTVEGSRRRSASLPTSHHQRSGVGERAHILQRSLTELLQESQNGDVLQSESNLNSVMQQQQQQLQQQQQQQHKQQQTSMQQEEGFACVNTETQAKARHLLNTLTSTLAQVQKQQQEQEARGLRGNLNITGLTPQQTQALKLLQEVAKQVSAGELLQSNQSQQQQQLQQQPQQHQQTQPRPQSQPHQRHQKQQANQQPQRLKQLQKLQRQQQLQQRPGQQAPLQPILQTIGESKAEPKQITTQIMARNFITTTGMPQVTATTASTLQKQPVVLTQARFLSQQLQQQQQQTRQPQKPQQSQPIQTLHAMQFTGQPQISLATPMTISSVQPKAAPSPANQDTRPKATLRLQSRPKGSIPTPVNKAFPKSKQLIKPRTPAKIAPAPPPEQLPVTVKSQIVTSTSTTSTALLTQLLAQGTGKYDTSPASISIRSDSANCTPVRTVVLQQVKSEPIITKVPCTQTSALSLALASTSQNVAGAQPKPSGSTISMVTSDSPKPIAARPLSSGFFTSALSSAFASPLTVTTATAKTPSPVITFSTANVGHSEPVQCLEPPLEASNPLPAFSISTSPAPLSPMSSPMSVVEDMDSLSDVNMSSKEEDRGGKMSHISAEQKRRVNIRSGFDQLHSLIPSLAQNPSAKISKANMLQKAVDYTKRLQTERKRIKDEINILKQEIAALHSNISDSQSQLPASGVPVTRQRVDMMRDIFDDYVRERTTQNWKFWIFSIIFRPLFESFNATVSTSSQDELTRSVRSWLDQHCSLLTLRPTVLSSLTLLSRTTSILSDPTQMPQQAVEAVTRKDEEVD